MRVRRHLFYRQNGLANGTANLLAVGRRALGPTDLAGFPNGARENELPDKIGDFPA